MLVQSAIAFSPISEIPFWSVGADVLLVIGLAAFPVAVALAVLRYRLFEIDRIISRTVTYGFVTGLLVAVYLATVFALRAIPPVEGPLAVAGSTLAVAALFNPLRRRVQHLVDRRFNRSRYDAELTLSQFSGRLRDQVDLGALKNEIFKVADRTVQPTTVAVCLRTPPSTDPF